MALPTVEVLCQQARQAIADRNWNKAREAYEKAVELQPGSADIHQGLATVCFQLRDLAAAATHFKEVTRLDPRRAGAFINLGAVYNLLDHFDDAVAVLRRAINLDPHRAEGFYNLGLVYRRSGQADLAIHAYREALRINPRLADAVYNLGNLYYEKEHYRQSLDCYEQAMKLREGFEKARLGAEAAREALAIQEAERIVPPAEEPPTPVPVPTKKIDLNKQIDPEAHGVVLAGLNKSTGDAESHGRKLLLLAEKALEPAIKELSTALISPSVSISVLDHCLRNFEEAMREVRSVKDSLHVDVQKVRLLGEQLLSDAH